jgi:hypothetical protein
VLLTLASTPVAAGNCTVASSFVSWATWKSRNPQASAQCTSYGIEYWRGLCSAPPVGMAPSADYTMLTTTNVRAWWQPLNVSLSAPYSSALMADVLRQGISTSDPLGVIQHLLALSLSCSKGYIAGPVTKPYLAGIWINYLSNGYRYRVPGVLNWGSRDLIKWLRYLMYTNPL